MSETYVDANLLPSTALLSLLVIFAVIIGIGFELMDLVVLLLVLALVLFSVYFLYRITVAVEKIASDP